MKKLLLLLFFPTILWAADTDNSKANTMSETQKVACSPALDFTIKALNEDKEVHLCQEYAGKLVMVVNTASKCGFTPQFEGLEELYEKYKSRGLVVLGFPSNDFGSQDPGSEKEVADFCRLTYGVKFPMFTKTRAAKSNADPIYRKLAELSGGTYPKWNFYKYVISPEGELIGTYSSFTKPHSKRLIRLIEKHLPEQQG